VVAVIVFAAHAAQRGSLGQPRPVSLVDVELRCSRTNGESRAMASSTMEVERCWLAVHDRRDTNGTRADGELLVLRLSIIVTTSAIGRLSQPGLLAAWVLYRLSDFR
jgi:hypothetical protein